MTTASLGRPIVVIPAWNESARLPLVLEALSRVLPEYEVVVAECNRAKGLDKKVRRAA